MSAIQLLAVVFALAMLYQTYLNFRRGELGLGGGLLWVGLWLALLVVSILPGPLRRLNGIINVARLLDLVTIGGLLVLGGITYRLYVLTQRLQKRIELLVRELAMRPVDETDEVTKG